MKKILLISILLLLSLWSVAQVLTDSNLPIIIIETGIMYGRQVEIVDEPKVSATMKIIYRPDGSRNYLTDQNVSTYLNYNGRIGIEIRGSSSQFLDKKAYGLTTFEADKVTKNNVSILGMPEENDWVLNSLAFDASLIRNYLSYDLARAIGNYSPRGVFCELIINGSYKGLYIFMEKIKIDSERVNIVKMTNADNNYPDLTGGYITKADKTTGGDPVAWSMSSYNGNTNYLHHRPKPNDITFSQGNYIKSQFTGFQNAITAQNASIYNGYPTIIDVPSFIDYMLISEITSNADSYQFSTYFHKDRNGKLRAGPVWDYDLTYGNDLFFWGLNRSHTNVWQFDNSDNTGSKFWKDLYNNPVYKCYLTKRWKELNADNEPLNFNVISDRIDQIVENILEASVRENTKWSTVGNHASEIANLKSWLQSRILWLNGKLSNYSDCSNPFIPQLVISKINYHPNDSEGFESDDSEFIEITNNSNQIVNLTGIYLRELGLTYQFPSNSSIGAGEKIIIASNQNTFQQRYGETLFGQFTRNLSNKSEKLILADAFGNIIDSVTYSDNAPWPVEADGNGYFLQLTDLDSDNSLASNWIISSSLTIGIISYLTEESVVVYPNPAQSNVTVASKSRNLNSFELFDLTGRKIKYMYEINSNRFTINVQDLIPDIYLLRVKCENGEIIVRRISKLP